MLRLTLILAEMSLEMQYKSVRMQRLNVRTFETLVPVFGIERERKNADEDDGTTVNVACTR